MMMRCIKNAGLCDRVFLSAFLIGRKGRSSFVFVGIDERAIGLQKTLKQAIGEDCRKVRVKRC